MLKDWRDFKELYGNIEGAREAFEKACETLFREVYRPQHVSQMAVKQGDGGIDVFVGKFAFEPIIVIQCKFFLDSFGDSQKSQIRESFNRAKNSADYELKEWILAIPRVIDIDENSWWFNWVDKQDNNIRLINANELIDLMKEYKVYNQIFQMEDSLKLDALYKHTFPPSENRITYLNDEKNFLDDIFVSIQRDEPVMLLSMTSTPYHNKIAKYYKEKVYKEAIETYSKDTVYLLQPHINEEISSKKYFSRLAKQCGFDKDVLDSSDLIELLEEKLNLQNIFLLISEFENGSDKYRNEFSLALRPLFENAYSYEYSFNVLIFGRKKLAELRYEENEFGVSPLNYFEEFLIPTPTIEDYEQIEKTDKKIDTIYTLTGGHPELMKLCLRSKFHDNRELLLNSTYAVSVFRKYDNRKERLLKLFKEEAFGQFSYWGNDTLLRDLFWDNLIVEDGHRFRWITPIVVEMGKRYFR